MLLEATKGKFRQELRKYINDLCSKSEKLYLDQDKLELVFSYYVEYENRLYKAKRKKTDIDRHKVASAFLCSILKANPIGYNADGVNPTDLERTANEQLGFLFGIYIIDTFNASTKEKTPLDMEICGLEIKLPECKGNADNDYTTHFVKLIIDKKVKKELDFEDESFNINLLFFLSHIYFLIDSFSYYRNAFDLKDK